MSVEPLVVYYGQRAVVIVDPGYGEELVTSAHDDVDCDERRLILGGAWKMICTYHSLLEVSTVAVDAYTLIAQCVGACNPTRSVYR